MMVTFSFLCNACISKKKILPVAHNSLWQMIRYNKGSEIMALDTAFLMVSNRHFMTEQVQFADEQTDTTQQHILYIGRKNNFIYVYELNSLQEGIALFPKKNWVLYTEGMGKTFTGNIERATLMTKTYDVQVILFDYASINSTLGGKKNFDFSMQNALASSHQYTQFLKEISTIHQQTTLFEGVHISLFLHSMGNLMFRKMMLDNEYKVLGETPLKMSLMPLLIFPDASSKFPLYFGIGGGPGIFFKQIADESQIAFDYQFLMGARFFDIVNQAGFFVETGMKNHLLVLTSGQFNGVFLTSGAVFTF